MHRTVVLLVLISWIMSQKICVSCKRHKVSPAPQINSNAIDDQINTKLLKTILKNNRFNQRSFTKILNKILIPRSVNSAGHALVRKYIRTSLQKLGPNWRVDEDSFTSRTPIGAIKFHNIIGTYVPDALLCTQLVNKTLDRIVLACHYDSLDTSLVSEYKHSASHSSPNFLGASDAAVSCALILYLAKFMSSRMDDIWSGLQDIHSQSLTLQLVFFDGEEALESKNNSTLQIRTKNSSLFGSRHLAKKWSQNYNSTVTNLESSKLRRKSQKANINMLTNRTISLCVVNRPSVPTMSLSKHRTSSSHYSTASIVGSFHPAYHNIDSVKLLLLMDLIGGSSPRFFNTNLSTFKQFQQLSTIEKRVIQWERRRRSTKHMPKAFFQHSPSFLLSLVRDDHLPFVVRNVPVLHLIPHPFPRNWHRLADNFASLDFYTIKRVTTVLQIFLLNSFNVL